MWLLDAERKVRRAGKDIVTTTLAVLTASHRLALTKPVVVGVASTTPVHKAAVLIRPVV